MSEPMQAPAALAFLGMGLMGSRMSRRLLQAGFEVGVWNRTPQACAPLLAAGAQVVDLAQLARWPVIALCLADDQAVGQVFDQMLPYLQQGQCIIDFSSLSVDMTRQLAARAGAKGISWIDAPVSGGVQGAESGNLIVFAGGDPARVASLAPLFSAVAQRVTLMGDTGAGQATKICNQLIVAATAQLIGEAVALAERAGVDSARLAPALAGGFADSLPLQILMPRMATRQFEPLQWKARTLDKDLGNALQLARQTGLDLPVAEEAASQYAAHLQHGHEDTDLSALIRLHATDA